MFTALTNIRSTKVLNFASCIMHHASCTASRKLRFGMMTALTNIRCYGRWKTTFSGRRPLVEDDL